MGMIKHSQRKEKKRNHKITGWGNVLSRRRKNNNKQTKKIKTKEINRKCKTNKRPNKKIG